jgi:hypothetical protein
MAYFDRSSLGQLLRKGGSSMKAASNFHWPRLHHGSNEKDNIFKPREATYSAEIAGGWLLKSMHFFGRSSSMTTQAMVFVPDATHKWQYDQESQGWQQLSQKSTVNHGDVTDKLEVWHGCVYRNSFFNANKEIHMSLIFVAEEGQQTMEAYCDIYICAKMYEEEGT